MKKNFTLIELLVVIAIIAVLASLLLPALKSAKETARSVTCVNNQKQHCLAVAMYSDDFDEWLPVMGRVNGSSDPLGWRVTLAPYLHLNTDYWWTRPTLRTGIFKCSSTSLPSTSETRYDGGYGWNRDELGYLDHWHEGWIHPGDGMDRHKLTELSNPSESIQSGDTSEIISNKYEYASLLPPSKGTSKVGNRHRNRINLSWVDGSVRSMSRNNLIGGRSGDTDWYYKAK